MKLHKVLVFALIASSQLLADTPANDRRTAFPYRFPLEAEQRSETEGVGVLQVTSEILEKSDQSLSDLHLFSGANIVPYQLVKRESGRQLESSVEIASEISSFQESEDGRITLEVALSDTTNPTPAISSITFVTPRKNFEHSVTVEAFQDGETWQQTGERQWIYDYTKHIDLRSTEVTIPAVRASLFRIVITPSTYADSSAIFRRTTRPAASTASTVERIEAINGQPFRIDAIRLSRIPEEETIPPINYPVNLERVTEAGDGESTAYIINTNSAPVRTLSLTTMDRNFRVPVRIEAQNETLNSDQEPSWRYIGTQFIHRFDIGGLAEEDLELKLPSPNIANRPKLLRLTLLTGANHSITLDDVKATGDSYEMRFLAEQGTSYTLYAGAGGAVTPDPTDFETAPIKAAFASDQVVKLPFSVKKVEDNPLYIPGASTWKITDSPLLLWASVALAFGALIWALMRAVRQVDEKLG